MAVRSRCRGGNPHRGKNDVPEERSLSLLPSARACTCHSPGLGWEEDLNNRDVSTFFLSKSQARTLVLKGTPCLPDPAHTGWLDYCTPKAKAGVTFQNLFASGPALSQMPSEVWWSADLGVAQRIPSWINWCQP